MQLTFRYGDFGEGLRQFGMLLFLLRCIQLGRWARSIERFVGILSDFLLQVLLLP